MTDINDWYATDYEQISQGEYKRLKKDDPVNYHSYTARIRHNYFKKKNNFPIVYKFDDWYTITITESGLQIEEDCKTLYIGKPDGERFRLLLEALNKCMEIWKQ
jgi:hypothetical protein